MSILIEYIIIINFILFNSRNKNKKFQQNIMYSIKIIHQEFMENTQSESYFRS